MNYQQLLKFWKESQLQHRQDWERQEKCRRKEEDLASLEQQNKAFAEREKQRIQALQLKQQKEREEEKRKQDRRFELRRTLLQQFEMLNRDDD
jgi:hypothetical protein